MLDLSKGEFRADLSRDRAIRTPAANENMLIHSFLFFPQFNVSEPCLTSSNNMFFWGPNQSNVD